MLSFFKIIKFFKNREIIKPTFHKIDPSETSKIINKRDIISRTSFDGYRRMSSHIIMHKIKRSKRRRNNFIKKVNQNILSVSNYYNQKYHVCPKYPRL